LHIRSLSLHDALPISITASTLSPRKVRWPRLRIQDISGASSPPWPRDGASTRTWHAVWACPRCPRRRTSSPSTSARQRKPAHCRSEEHTSELQSPYDL